MSITTHFMPMLTALFRTILQASWQGALAIVLVLLVRRVLGVRVPARWHYLLWFLVLVRLLVPAFVLPHSRASLENIYAVGRPLDRQLLPPPRQEVLAGWMSVVPRSQLPLPRITASRLPATVVPAATTPLWSWQADAALTWLAGAISLCCWLGVCSLSLRRRVQRETFPADANTVTLWHECCRRWLHRVPPPVLTATWVQSPALVGAWRPTLLLPVQMPDLFSVQDWEHVFAHEIAHLRWRDHWSQLLLHLVQCVHWFNPLVWVGLRRLRADRELSADEWALHHLAGERTLAYGETLFKTLANRPSGFSFQPGVVGLSEDGSQMKQRLRRITAFLPRRLLGSFAGLVVVLLLGTVVLGQGSPGQPSPSAQPTAASAPRTQSANSEPAKVPSPASHTSFVNSGRVSMADGTALGSEPITAYMRYGGSGSWGGTQVAQNGVFYLNLPADAPRTTTTVTVTVEQRGCAVTFEGPVTLENLDKRGSLEVKLARGYTASVQIVDETGKPVPGAQLRPYYPGPPEVELEAVHTDSSGMVALEHLGEAPLNIRVLADGFQGDEVTRLHLDPAHPYRWTLTSTPPLHGKVVAAATGKPVAGAVIKLGGVRGPHDEIHSDPKQATVLTTTDEQGDFKLGSLRSDSRYYLFVEAPGYGGAYLRGVSLSAGNPNVALGPELMIRGKIIHAPPSVVHLGKVYLQYGQTFNVGENSGGTKEESVDLKPVNGEADFAVGPFYKVYGEFSEPKKSNSWDRKPIGIYVDTWGRADFNIDELPISDFVFDLAKQSDPRSGPAKTEDDSNPADKPADASPEPTATPTSAVKAIELDATVSTWDGKPVGYHAAEIHPSVTFGPGGMRDFLVFPSFNSPEGTTNMRIPADAKDVSFAVTDKGYATAFAGPFLPPLEEKLKGLHFTLKKGFTAEIQVMDEAGRPIAGARIQSGYSKPLVLDVGETTTDDDGTARLEHLTKVPIDLRVRADGYQTDELDGVQLDATKPYSWTLKHAQSLEGVVTAAATGKFIAGAKIKLAAVRGPYSETNADTHTAPVWATSDSQGRFVLTSLRPDSRYFLFVEAPGYGGVLLHGIQTNQPKLKIALGLELFIKGRFLHIPAASINAYDHTFAFGYDQFFDIDGNFCAVGQQGRITPKDGEAEFTIRALYDNSVLIIAEGKETKLEATALPKSGLVIDLAKQTSGEDSDEETSLPDAVTTGVGQKSR